MNWQDNLVSDRARIRELLAGTRTIAVLAFGGAVSRESMHCNA